MHLLWWLTTRPPRKAERGRESVTIYFQGQSARITHEVYEAFGPVSESFLIRELRSVHIVTPDAQQKAFGGIWSRVVSIVLAVATFGVAMATWQAMESSEVVVVVLLTTTVSSLIAAGCWRVSEKPWEIRATYRGRSVCLLQTCDQILLGQVRRALLRALEREVDRY